MAATKAAKTAPKKTTGTRSKTKPSKIKLSLKGEQEVWRAIARVENAIKDTMPSLKGLCRNYDDMFGYTEDLQFNLIRELYDWARPILPHYREKIDTLVGRALYSSIVAQNSMRQQ